MPTMTMDDFEVACRARWSDLISNAPIAWYMVSSQTHMPHGGPHLVLVQNQIQMFQAHIVHWDAWPILAKHRAVLFPEGTSVQEVARKLQLNVPRGYPDALIAFSFDAGHGVQWLYSQEPVHVHSAEVFHAAIHQPINVPQANGSESEGISNQSTHPPLSVTSDNDEEEDTFSATLTAWANVHFDQHGPYPWEVDDPVDLQDEEESEEPGLPIAFPYEDRFQMNQHAQFLRACPNGQEETWVAVTYGVGLTDLGRRDVEFQWNDLDRVPDLIHDLWRDHSAYGDATLYFVTPQPEGQHVKPCLVFLVVIVYTNHHGVDDRWILVRESSQDASVVAQRPYGALVISGSTPRAIMAQLGHHECFPFGVRDCHVRLEGRWIEHNVQHVFRNGALCDAYVGPYPPQVDAASDEVVEAEALFKVARAHFENLPGSTLLTLRVHGISPANNPLGYRDVCTDYPDLASLDWVAQIKQLWPFRPEFAKCIYLPRGDLQADLDIDQPILHLIVSYVVEPQGVPVLIRQRLHAVHDPGDIDELWAVVIPDHANEIALRKALDRKPFWFHQDATTHIYRDDRYVGNSNLEWNEGDVVDLRINVLTTEYQLSALWDMSTRASESYGKDRRVPIDAEFEEASLLQLGGHSQHDELAEFGSQVLNDHFHSSTDAFNEICQACMACGESGRNEYDESPDKPPTDDPSEDDQPFVQVNDKQVVQLSLEHTLLPGPRTPVLTENIYQLFEEGDWARVFQLHWPDALAWLPEGMNVHPSTWEALHSQCFHDWSEVNRVELYTDGATHADDAGWSVVMITHANNGVMCRGIISGHVCTDKSKDQWIGACGVTNITAEVSAMIIAQALALSLHGFVEIVIRPDLSLSKQLADIHATIRKEQVLTSVSACLSRLVPGHFRVEEVRAHKGHPWNELADGAAKQAARTGNGVGKVPWSGLRALACNSHDCNWNWLQCAKPNTQAAYPPVFDGMVVQFPDAVTEANPTVCKAEDTQSPSTVTLQLCSLNVLALDVKEDGTGGSRIIRLDKQMHDQSCDILCLQEARSLQGQRMTDHYVVYSSGGAGHKAKQFLGCEIWFHRFRPIVVKSDGTKLYWKDFKVNAICADPRRLMLHLSGPMQLVVASLHAPCLSQDNSVSEIENRWQGTCLTLEPHCHGQMLVGCDANAPLATVANEHHGMVGAEPSNIQGQFFEASLQQLRLAVPSTFPCHTGGHGTWKHPKGKLLRRDYVLVSVQMLPAVQSSRVMTDVDLGFSHVDHSPVACTLKFVNVVTNPLTRIKWDRKKMADPVLRKQFQEDLHALPIPLWEVDVDTHNQYFNHNVRALAARHFTQDTKKDKNQTPA